MEIKWKMEMKGLDTNYGRLSYHLWHRPLKMALLVYEREIGIATSLDACLSNQLNH